MGWFRVQLTPAEQATVYRERESHADSMVRRKLWTLSLLHAGLTRETAAKIQGLDYATIERHVAEFRDGGLEATCRSVVRYQSRSELADHEAAFAKRLPRNRRERWPKLASESRNSPALFASQRKCGLFSNDWA